MKLCKLFVSFFPWWLLSCGIMKVRSSEYKRWIYLKIRYRSGTTRWWPTDGSIAEKPELLTSRLSLNGFPQVKCCGRWLHPWSKKTLTFLLMERYKNVFLLSGQSGKFWKNVSEKEWVVGPGIRSCTQTCGCYTLYRSCTYNPA